MKFAIDVAPFDELADPRLLAELAATAEERGWDGFFVWDHIVYRAPVQAVLDPWVALAAIACATSRVRIGTNYPDSRSLWQSEVRSVPRALSGARGRLQ